MDKTIAAFIICYERPAVVLKTIEAYFLQELPPSVILLIDNSKSNDVQDAVLAKKDARLIYFKTGYNAGPAGASRKALIYLFNMGFEWVIWGDDDDPPLFPDSIKRIMDIIVDYGGQEPLGMIGAVGANFNYLTGKIKKLKHQHLNGIKYVDSIAGNMLPIIHRSVYEKGILPDERLFFGLEELDFSLAIRRAGFAICVSGDEIHRYRSYWNRLTNHRSASIKRSFATLWREYYSLRNLLYILAYKEKRILPFIHVVVRNLLKIPFGFTVSYKYGRLQALMILKAFKDFGLGKMGRQIEPQKKVSN